MRVASSRVLLSLQDSLQAKGYRVLRYNSRGVGRSTGWASFKGFSEAKDLEALVKWAMVKVVNVHSLVIVVSRLVVPVGCRLLSSIKISFRVIRMGLSSRPCTPSSRQ